MNCLTEMLGLDFKTAVKELAGGSVSRVPRQENNYFSERKKDLVLPEKADNMKKVFAYLCQTRKINPKIVSELAHEKLLYQDKRGNAVFLHKNDSGEIVGAEIQGTNTYKRFKSVAEGTSDSLFSVKIGLPNRAYVFESAIDLLSFKQLANPDKIQNSVLVSMAGLRPDSLKVLSERELKLYSCADNDEKGIKFTSDNGLIPCNGILRENDVKDFNEMLQMTEQNREARSKSRTAQTAEKSSMQQNADAITNSKIR